MDSDSCSVRVVARFRPINERERKEGEKEQFTLAIEEDTRILLKSKSSGEQKFKFDRTFGTDSNQEEVYEYTARQTIEDVLNGYNGTIFAYGQTGSGKTFTMFGPDVIEEEKHMGIVPRASAHIFRAIREDTREIQYSIKASFLEIYKEKIRDLLNPAQNNLPVRESATKGIYVEHLTEEYVGCEQDISDLIAQGELSRSVASTNMNQRSSRSHSLFIITIEQKNLEDDSTRVGRLNLIDLAGSEKVGKTGATGNTLDEAKKINQSLSALGNCIHALTEAKRGHIPYRDSKLTRVLQESLGGNTKTTLVVTASPHVFNVEETISSLRFGARAKTIQNKVTQNVQRSAEELMIIVTTLKGELVRMRKYATKLEKQISYMKSPDYDPSKPIPKELLAAAPKQRSLKGTPTKSKASTPKGMSTPPRSSAASRAPMTPGSPAPAGYDPVGMAEAMVTLDKLKISHANQVDTLKESISDLEGTVAEQKASISTAEEQVAHATAELHRAQQASAELKEDMELKLADAVAAQLRQEKKLENMKMSLEEREKTCAGLEEKLEEKEGEYRELAVERDGLLEKITSLEASSQQGEAAVQQLESDKASTEARLKDVERKMEEAEAHVTQAREQHKQAEEAIERLEAANVDLESQLVDSNAAITSAGEQKRHVEEKLAKVQKELEESISSYEHLKELLNTQSSSKAASPTENGEGAAVEQSSGDSAILIETLEADAKKMEQKIADLQAAMKEKEAKESVAEEQLISSKGSAKKAELEAEKLRAKLEQSSSREKELSERVSGLEADLAAAGTRLGEAESRCQVAERSVSQQGEQSSKSQAELQATTHKLRAAEQEVRAAKDALEKEQRKMASHVSASKSNERELADVQARNGELEGQLREQKSAATSARHQVNTLTAENERLTEELQAKAAVADESAALVESLRKQLAEVESRRSRLFKPMRVGPASSHAKPMHSKIDYGNVRQQLRKVNRDMTR